MTDRLAAPPEWLEHDAEHFDTPAVIFEGDDAVPVAYADAITYDPKGKDYPRQTIPGMLKIAQKFDADIDLATYECTKRMVDAPEAADPYIDAAHTPIERRRRFDLATRVVRELFDPSVQLGSAEGLAQIAEEDALLGGALRYWANSVRPLDTQTRMNIRHHALGTLAFSQRKTEATNVHDYGISSYMEGRHYGLMWAETIWSGQPRVTWPAKERFAQWTARGVSALSLLDSAVDLSRDYREGNTRLVPTVRNRLTLLGMSALDAPRVVLTGLRLKLQS